MISDYGGCTTNEANVAAMVNGWAPDFIVTAGDNWQGSDMDGGGACDTYAEAVGAYYGSFITGGKFWPAPGNHDYSADNPDGLDHYIAYFDDNNLPQGTARSEPSYYDFVQGPVHFFMIDSQAIEAYGDTAQKTWLQNALAASMATGTSWSSTIQPTPRSPTTPRQFRFNGLSMPGERTW